MLEHAAVTDTGRVREHNEDAHVVVPLLDGLLVAVADGMGGHAAGEVASALAIEGVQRAGRNTRKGESALPQLELQVARAHAMIREQAQDGREGMGCTLTAAALRPGKVELLQIGDSRAYLAREDGLEQLTDDDSLVGEMVRAAVLSAEEARHHPARSVLTKALGIGGEADFALLEAEVKEGDVLLLCSDGLTSLVDDQRIHAILVATKGLPAQAKALVAAANDAGGTDNITVVLARCKGAA